MPMASPTGRRKISPCRILFACRRGTFEACFPLSDRLQGPGFRHAPSLAYSLSGGSASGLDLRAPLEFFREFVLHFRRLNHQTGSYRFKAENLRRSRMFLAPIERPEGRHRGWLKDHGNWELGKRLEFSNRVLPRSARGVMEKW
jgi:hypothetical protein